MPRRSALASAALALVLTLTSTAVSGRARMVYPDIMGCERGCAVAAAGLPAPFIVDYPGLSPVGRVDLVGVLLGLDRVLWARAVGALAVWFMVSVAVVRAVARVAHAHRAA